MNCDCCEKNCYSYYERLKHLLQSDFIRTFDEFDAKTRGFKRDISEADKIVKDAEAKKQSSTDKSENYKKMLKEARERADSGWERVHYLERKSRNTEALNDQLLLELARRQNADESGKVKYITVGKPELYIGGEKSGNCTVTLLDLKQTIPLMQSEDYKERFIAEWAQTKIRLNKLDRMLQRHYSGTLDFELTCPIILLEKQLLAMQQYADMLEVRAEIERIELPTEKLMEGET